MTKTIRNPVLAAAFCGCRFAGRRAIARLRSDPQLDTLIVDVDRTLTLEDSPKLALESLCGKAQAKKVFDRIFRGVILGDIKADMVQTLVFKELYSHGFRRGDWGALMEDYEKRGGFRKELIKALLEHSDLTMVLATRSSVDSARWIAKRFGFAYAIGSEERFDSGFAGFSTRIGMHDGESNGAVMMTKMTAASRLLAKIGKTLDPKRTAVLSNDLLDALEMLSCARGILLLPKTPNRLERLTYGFRLYDVTIDEKKDLRPQLFSALGIAERQADYLPDIIRP